MPNLPGSVATVHLLVRPSAHSVADTPAGKHLSPLGESKKVVGYSLRLRRIVVPVHVGVSAGERSRAQDVLLDIDLELPVGRYPATDDLESTVDYGEIVSAADACATEQPYRLLETFVLRVARRLEVCFPQVNTLRVAGTKATVPVLPATQAAIVEVTLGGMTS